MGALGYIVVSASAAVMASIMGVGGQALGKNAAMKVFWTAGGCSGEVAGVGIVVSTSAGVESVVSIGLLRELCRYLIPHFIFKN